MDEAKTVAIKAFVKAQKEMGPALKDRANPAFKTKYADLGSVQEACFPSLHANGFAVMQPSGFDDHGEFVETVFLHESGHQFSTRVYLKIGKQDMQGWGSAQTYARRYGLMGLAGIAPEDDDGNAAAKSMIERRPDPLPEPRLAARAEPQEPGAVAVLISAVNNARDMDELIDIWKGHARSPAAADERAFAAKEAKKKALTATLSEIPSRTFGANYDGPDRFPGDSAQRPSPFATDSAPVSDSQIPF